MQRLITVVAFIAGAGLLLQSADWPMPAGGPQRNGWARSERLIDKTNVKQLELLYKFQAENTSRGLYALSAPAINGNLITYVGFKEMLLFGASSNKAFSIDADVNKPIWISDLAVQSTPSASVSETCPGGMTAPVVFAGSSSVSRRFNRASPTPTAGTPNVRRSPYFPPLSQSVYPLLPTTLTQLAAIYTVSSDGYLHVLNSSTGQDLLPRIRFLAPNAKVTSLNIQDNVVYATSGDNCDGFRNALFALDLLSPDKKVTSFAVEEGGFAGQGGTTIGLDGTVYVQVFYAPAGEASKPRESVVALTPKTLAVKDYVVLSDKVAKKDSLLSPGITPLVFPLKGRDVLAAAGRDGRLYLLDSKSLGGTDHMTPLFKSEVFAQTDRKYAGNGFRGTFTSWLDFATGTRWLYAPLFGPASPQLKSNRAKSAASLVAFKLGEQEGRPMLQSAWTSDEIESPASPISANGMVFVLSTGAFPRLAKPNGKPYSLAERKQMSKPARLLALDGVTGSELFGSEKAATAPSHNGALALANGRIYFTTDDSAVYCFGLLKGQSQLSEQR